MSTAISQWPLTSEEPGRRFRAYPDSISAALNAPADLDEVEPAD